MAYHGIQCPASYANDCTVDQQNYEFYNDLDIHSPFDLDEINLLSECIVERIATTLRFLEINMMRFHPFSLNIVHNDPIFDTQYHTHMHMIESLCWYYRHIYYRDYYDLTRINQHSLRKQHKIVHTTCSHYCYNHDNSYKQLTPNATKRRDDYINEMIIEPFNQRLFKIIAVACDRDLTFISIIHNYIYQYLEDNPDRYLSSNNSNQRCKTATTGEKHRRRRRHFMP